MFRRLVHGMRQSVPLAPSRMSKPTPPCPCRKRLQSDIKSVQQAPRSVRPKRGNVAPQATYVCPICQKTGHWEKDCPVAKDPSVKKVKLPNGVPTSVLMLNPDGGLLLEGQIAVSVADAQRDILQDLQGGAASAPAPAAGAEGKELVAAGEGGALVAGGEQGNAADTQGASLMPVLQSGTIRRPLPRPADWKEREIKEKEERR